MPGAGLTRDDVVRAAASLAGEIGYPAVTIDLLAERSASAPPSLYKHRCQPRLQLARDAGTTPTAYRAAYQGRPPDAREAGS